MTTFFLGGSLGTLFAGLGWNYAGWDGVCLAGLGFASMVTSYGLTRNQWSNDIYNQVVMDDLFEP